MYSSVSVCDTGIATLCISNADRIRERERISGDFALQRRTRLSISPRRADIYHMYICIAPTKFVSSIILFFPARAYFYAPHQFI